MTEPFVVPPAMFEDMKAAGISTEGYVAAKPVKVRANLQGPFDYWPPVVRYRFNYAGRKVRV